MRGKIRAGNFGRFSRSRTALGESHRRFTPRQLKWVRHTPRSGRAERDVNPPALHIVGDALIASAYFTIALALWRLLRSGRMVFPALFLLFGAFLAASGLAHITDAVASEVMPGFAAAFKLIAAAVSLVTAALLVRIVPAVLQLPTRTELENRVHAHVVELRRANEKLRREAGQREEAEAEVRRLNLELHERLAEVQSLFKLLPVGIAIATDASCRRIRSNRAFAEMFGLPIDLNSSLSAEPFELPAELRFAHGGRELGRDELPMQRAILDNSAVRDFDQTITRRDGATFEVLVNAVPIRGDDGRPRGCVATFQDISARQQATRNQLDFERKLLQSQKLESIGLLAGGIAHDFNNLLTGILGHTNFARAELARGASNIDSMLAQVEVSAQRAADLCRQLLAYAGKGQFVVRLIDLNVSVQQTVPLLNLAVSKKVAIELQLGRGLPPFRGDTTQIGQTLINLVTNASEAIGASPGTITIRTDRVTLTPMDMLTLTGGHEIEPGPCVALEVRDTGSGIAPEAIAHIFEPFFTTKFVGRGLGLAAVLGIVHGHRGAIRVTSQIGAGTTFELFFPVATAPARSTSPGFAPGPTRGKVLVVDDDETVRHFACTALTAGGYSVVTAVDGEDALAKLRQDPLQFDAVLLDLSMPKLDGEDTLMALRMLTPNLPVILMSGHSEHVVAQRFVGRGVAEFLSKPFVSEVLLTALNGVMTRARAQI